MNLTILLIAAYLPLPLLLFMILRSGSFGKGSIGTMLKLFFLGVAVGYFIVFPVTLRFLADYLPKYEQSRESGYISLITCNHDTPRPRRTLDMSELKIAYAMFLTLPGVPFIYYGDEIGMRYLDIPTKEGGYTRTGTRTPMQWNHDKNYGFSSADADKLYLPQDSADDAPTVEDQLGDKDSLLNTVKELTALRHKYEDLQADGEFEVIYADPENFPFVYKRGHLMVAINPSDKKAYVKLPKTGEVIHKIGNSTLDNLELKMEPQSFVVIK